MAGKLIVPQAAKGVARFTFDALVRGAARRGGLCRAGAQFPHDPDRPRSALREARTNEARRFTLLVDTLYDERVKLVCSAAAAPAALFSPCEGTPMVQAHGVAPDGNAERRLSQPGSG